MLPRQIVHRFYEYLLMAGSMASVSKEWNAAVKEDMEKLKQKGISMVRDERWVARFYDTVQAWKMGSIQDIPKMDTSPGVILLRFQMLELLRQLVLDIVTTPYYKTVRVQIQEISNRYSFLESYRYQNVVRIRAFLMDCLSGLFFLSREKIHSVVDCLLKIIRSYRYDILGDYKNHKWAKIFKKILSYSQGHYQTGMLSATSVRWHNMMMREISRRKRQAEDKHQLDLPDLDFLSLDAPNNSMLPHREDERDPWDTE